VIVGWNTQCSTSSRWVHGTRREMLLLSSGLEGCSLGVVLTTRGCNRLHAVAAVLQCLDTGPQACTAEQVGGSMNVQVHRYVGSCMVAASGVWRLRPGCGRSRHTPDTHIVRLPPPAAVALGLVVWLLRLLWHGTHSVCSRSGTDTRAPKAALGPKAAMSKGVCSHLSTLAPASTVKGGR
jgi:hypothetical protein